MNNIIPFNFDGAHVRVVMKDGEPWFVAKDVAQTLGYSNFRDAILKHCKGGRKTRLPSTGGEQEYTIIPEPDVYRLIIRSKLPEAERFEKWVMEELLPTIRKTGGFQVPITKSEALQLAADQARIIEEQQPKVEFYDAITGSKDAISMGDAAKVLDLGMGRNRLFLWLQGEGFLMADNRPYQRYIDCGWFRVIEQSFIDSHGKTHITFKTLVYQRGLDAILRRWKQKRYAPELEITAPWPGAFTE